MINWISSASCHWELQCGSHNCRQGCVTPLTCPVLALIRSCILHRVAFPADSHLIGSENEPVQLINFSLLYTPEHVYMYLLVFCLSFFSFCSRNPGCVFTAKVLSSKLSKLFWNSFECVWESLPGHRYLGFITSPAGFWMKLWFVTALSTRNLDLDNSRDA